MRNVSPAYTSVYVFNSRPAFRPGEPSWCRNGLVGALCTLLLTVFLSWLGAPLYAQTFTNPIDQVESADPYVTYHNGQYYYLRTTGDIRIQRSPNLQDVGNAPETVVFRPGQNGILSDIWAPELHALNGRWYIYACGNPYGGLGNGPQRMFVLESVGSDPLGPYNFKSLLVPDAFAIDETVLIRDSDQKAFLVWCQWEGPEQCIYIGPLDNPWTVGNPRVRLSRPEFGWERIGGPVNEGPTILKRNGKVHIVYSASGTWTPDYCLGRLTNSNGEYLNPAAWAKSPNPIFARSDANGVWCVGHNCFTKSPDGTENWNVYHGTHDPNGNQQPLRSTRMQRFTWNADDTPNLGIPVRLGVSLPNPSTNGGGGGGIVSGRTYLLRARHSGKCAEVGSALLPNGSNVNQFQIWNPALPCQKWTAYGLGGGYWKFINVNSGRCLEVGGYSTAPGGNVQQWDWVANSWQQWSLAPAGDGYFKVVNRGSNLLLDVEGGPAAAGNGTNISQYYDLGGANQQWAFDEVSPLTINSIYSITALHSNQCADVEGGNPANGTNISQYPYTGVNWQKWRAVDVGGGFVRFVNIHTNKSMEVVNFSPVEGGNILQWETHDHPWQKWRLDGTDGGNAWRVVNQGSGLCMDVAEISTTYSANIWQWTYFGSQNQKWKFDLR